MIYFEVVIEGIVHKYSKFNQARDEYLEFKKCGFHDAVLYRVEEVNVTSTKSYGVTDLRYLWDKKLGQGKPYLFAPAAQGPQGRNLNTA